MLVKNVPTRINTHSWHCVRRDLELPTVKEMIAELVITIKRFPNKLNMRSWHMYNGCNTTHCVAGFVDMMFNPDYSKNQRLDHKQNRYYVPVRFKNCASDFAMAILVPDGDSKRQNKLNTIFYAVDDTTEQVITRLAYFAKGAPE